MIVLPVALLLLATLIASVHYQLAIIDEVEEGTPLAQRRSFQVKLEPQGATLRAALREHRKRFPRSVLRRRYYIMQYLALLLFVALLGLMTYQ